MRIVGRAAAFPARARSKQRTVPYGIGYMMYMYPHVPHMYGIGYPRVSDTRAAAEAQPRGCAEAYGAQPIEVGIQARYCDEDVRCRDERSP